MKSVFSIIFMTVFILATAASAFAGDMTHSSPESVSVNSEGIAEIEITVSGGYDIYAGAQFELILGEGVAIESVSFDKGGNSNIIPPTLARGSYFFSLFAGMNEFEGDFTCSVTISLEGNEPSEVTIVEIQRYYVESPGVVLTTTDSTQSVIQVMPVRALGDSLIPLGFFAQYGLWLIIAVAAAVVAILLIRKRRKKNADKGKITIDKAEYERLLAQRDEAKRGNTDSE